MDFIKLWSVSVAIFLILATVMDSLIPNGKFKKYSALIISLMIIILVIKPIRNIDLNFDYQIPQMDNTALINVFKENLETNIEEKWKGVEANAEISIDDDNQLNIEKVTIKKAKQKEEIQNDLTENYRVETVVFE